MRPFYLLCFSLFASLYTYAQFSGDYDPIHWTTVAEVPSTGTVSVAGAPASITLEGSNDPTASRRDVDIDVDYTIAIPIGGVWSFNWSYHTSDGSGNPKYDIAGILINGTFSQLTSNKSGLVDQSGGYTSTFLPAGTIIGFRVESKDNQAGSATFTISNFSVNPTTLPLKLLSFSALPKEGAVLLQWNTASEVNTSHFEVERSTDGRSFSSIGRVPAGQRSGQYSFADRQPATAVSFYRLRMVDVDSKHTFSGTVAVRLSLNSTLQVYPNPARQATAITIQSKGSGVETIRLFDASGRCLKTEHVMVAEGINRKQIDLNGLPGGVYYIRLGRTGTSEMLIKE
jgi:hypothetical protein